MQGQMPESVARDPQGNLIVSMSPQHTLWKVLPRAQYSAAPLATLPVPDGANVLGVKIGENGDIFACTAGFNPAIDASHVWRVSPSGSVSDYARLDPRGFPNDIAIDDSGHLFVTDTVLGVIYRIDSAGAYETWLADPQLSGDPAGPLVGIPWGANGIALDRCNRQLYISNSDFGQILRVRIRPDGSAGQLSHFASDPRLRGADGIAFDELGRLYVAVNTQNQIARVEPWGTVSIVAQGAPFDGPSALAFASDHLHRTTLYVTSFALGTATAGGIAQPSLDGIRVPFGGLPMP